MVRLLLKSSYSYFSHYYPYDVFRISDSKTSLQHPTKGVLFFGPLLHQARRAGHPAKPTFTDSGNVPFDVEEAQLRALFEEVGIIQELTLFLGQERR